MRVDLIDRTVTFHLGGPASRTNTLRNATQMVHELKEHRRGPGPWTENGPSGEGGTRLPPTSLVSSIAELHPNGCLTSPGPPHLNALSIH
ncbi:hypothetical protein KIN20_029847 [Parelaphostrongylus tenuis]|uniref:Uncharacterized protein n=1 Tax=Parelaphostrongylus tenuis TaxID=148309 RepID=A0AAD5R300_PARTN|nr:hypothetical protein KIN20_029847 [Parelaphostrongylus tenuis]